MSAPTVEESSGPTSPGTTSSGQTSSVDPLVRERVRRGRRTTVVVVFLVLATLLIAWLGSGARQGTLDPLSYSGQGSRAIAALLEQQGVTIVRVTSSQEAATAIKTAGNAGATLLVTAPDLLSPTKVKRLNAAGAATVVLLAPTLEPALSTWGPGVEVSGPATDEVRDPQCAWRPATRAGRTQAGGVAYIVTAPQQGTTVEQCYLYESDPTVVHLTQADGRTVTVLGDPLVLTNDQLARDGNAALALNTLGERSTVVWYLPSATELDEAATTSFGDLIPSGVKFAFLQLAVAVVLLALWRLRRLGAVVAEPLPVIVRSSETLEGRGRLYRQVRARERAATALRASTIDRLRRRTGLPARCTPDMLVVAVAARTSHTEVVVRQLLYGAVPREDSALVHLADALDSLEGEVNRS